jgi:hypothetical protein
MIAAPERTEVYPFRRLLARVFDTLLVELLVVWGCILWLGFGRTLGLATSIGVCALMLLMEMVFLLLNVSTPGKWLFSIRVYPIGDSRVGVWRAFDRGFTAFTIGAGCYLPLLGWYAMIQSYRSLTETGATTWDRGKFSIVHGPLRWKRFLIAVGAVIALFALIAVTVAMHENRGLDL